MCDLHRSEPEPGRSDDGQISPLTRWPGVEVRPSLSPERSLAYKGSIQCQLIPSWEPLEDATAVIIIPTWAQLEDRAVLLPAEDRGGNHPRRQLWHQASLWD